MHRENEDSRLRYSITQLLGHLDTVDIWQTHICDDDIRVSCRGHAYALVPGGSLAYHLEISLEREK
jgi:hypothetical protein